jgi:hypothetical protein
MRSLILVPLLVLAACGSASDAQPGKGTAHSASGERSYDLAGFHAISLEGRHNVLVKVGEAHSVRAEGPAEVLDTIEIEVERGTLRIREKRRTWSNPNRAPATIFVTAPAIDAASIGGSGDISIDEVRGKRFSGSIGGSGDITVARMAVGEARLSVAGSGNLRAAGSTDELRLSVAGSGDVDTARLASRTVHVSVAGSGDAKVRASDQAFVSLVGSGDVTIEGTAKCSVSKLGSGSVRCPRAASLAIVNQTPA